MQVIVDLARCQSYGQCVYAAPSVFRLEHEEILEWEYSPGDDQADKVRQAAHACPVRAISFAATRGKP
jgi:ferredoxin